MKLNRINHNLCLLAIGILLAGFALRSQAQPYTNYIVDQFDTDVNGWGDTGWGPPTSYQLWDDTKNATSSLGPNNSGSGAMNVLIDWTGYTGAQALFQMYNFQNGTVLNLNQYTNVSFDIMFDPTSATNAAGTSYGALEVGVIPTDQGWDSTSLGVYTSAITNGNGWMHVSVPLASALAANSDLSAVEGIYFKLQQNNTGSNLGGISDFWLDNIIFGGNTNRPPKTALTISPVTTPAGLMLVNGGGGGVWTRTIMLALDVTNGARNFSWVGQGNTPVTYSHTLVQYPANQPAMQDVIWLAQNSQAQDSGPDYDLANCAQLSMYGNSDGTATASFQFKTNQPGGNSQYTANTLATLTAPSALGTWSLTFLNDTNVTMSYAPLGGGSGVSTNFVFADETTVSTYFSNPLGVYMGNQLNQGKVGQSTTYSEFKISGVTASPSLDSVWSNMASLDTTNWSLTTYASDMFLVHPTDKFWVSWTLPDSGLVLQANTNLANPSGWSPVGAPKILTTIGDMALLPGTATNFSVGNAAYFLMTSTNSTQ